MDELVKQLAFHGRTSTESNARTYQYNQDSHTGIEPSIIKHEPSTIQDSHIGIEIDQQEPEPSTIKPRLTHGGMK